ncbi:MAG: ABC transporter ATP-binding protein [Bryobacteraceae bacterium]
MTRLRSIVENHLRRNSAPLVVSALCLIGYSVGELLAPWPLKLIFDHILLDRTAPAWLAPLLSGYGKGVATIVLALAILAIAASKGICAYGQVYLSAEVGFGLVHALRKELFAHLQRLSLSFHNRSRAGELLTKVSSDTNTLRDTFTSALLEAAGRIFTLLGMFGILFWLNWKLSLIVLVTFPLLGFTMLTIYRRTRVAARAQRDREGKLAARIHESLGSAALVRAFARESHEQRLFDEESGRSFQEGVRAARMEGAAARTVEVINAGGVCATVLFGSLMALRGEMTPGDVLVFASYLGGMYKPLRILAKMSLQLSKAMVSVERVSSILEEDARADSAGSIRPIQLHGAITFRHVSFTYEGGRRALNDVSFSIEPGRRVALVGSSGAGKSTIASLLLRFYEPSEGCVSIDGVNAARYCREALRNQIGVVLQDSLLFGASIRDNIAYGKPDATAGEVEAAARQAFAHSFICSLPDGYDTVVGERGSTLSGGQRQRLCIARALIKPCSILLLDEPTAAVDPESSALIHEALERLQSGRTTLVISHQFSNMDRFDKVLVLKDGSLLEEGTHAQLMDKGGYYYELYRARMMSEPVEEGR